MKKAPIAASLLILTTAAILGWRGHQQLAAAKEEQQQLIAKAASLGIILDPADTRANGGKSFNRGQRVDQDALVRQMARDAMAFANEMETLRLAGTEPDKATQQRSMDFVERMTKLNGKQLQLLLAEFKTTTGLNDETRGGLINLTLYTFSSVDPQGLLKLFSDSPETFKGAGTAGQFISSALARLAGQDPLAAADWMQKNAGKNPNLFNEYTKTGILAGAAAKDSAIAFQLLDRLGIEKPEQSVATIVNVAKTPAERDATLAALHQYAATVSDETKRKQILLTGIGQLCTTAVGDGFETGSKWIEGSHFSADELQSIAKSSMLYNIKPGDNPQWIAWLGDKLPTDQSEKAINRLVGEWTRNDYQAAGEWLATAPDGDTKNAAIKSYATTVSSYAPEAAAQWALTLPPGPNRDSTLKTIYNRWPKEDPASSSAAEAFAKEHGIK